MSARRSGAGTGFGIAGVGCVLLVGFLSLSAVLVCSGFGGAIWARMPRIVEVSPPRPVAGTDPAPEPEARPISPRPRRPRPTGPKPKPPPEPEDPMIVEVESDTLIVAEVSLAGDASEVFAVTPDGTAYPLPAALPRGTYDLQVSFAGRAPFVAGSIAILDGTAKAVTCRESLGICKVR
ncbi:MAG: hypothetical protein H6737_26495 [Alphaproteobacteria bacterium]|nr:hypothetical protein [Alphaproteobacteria bacterium]